MKRAFKYVSLVAAGTPQPLFGSTTSAIVGQVGTETTSLQSIPVADSSIFAEKDSDHPRSGKFYGCYGGSGCRLSTSWIPRTSRCRECSTSIAIACLYNETSR